MTRRKESKLHNGIEQNPDCTKQDKISLLPDELLVQILSCMTLRQAVNTSVLSKRWTNLWTRIPHLTFDGPNVFGQELSCATQRLKSHQFVSWVDSLVNQMKHRSVSILSFSLSYEISEKDVSHIDQWVSFAIEHDVQTLNLFFRKADPIDWSFPPQLASSDKLCSLQSLCLGGVKIVPTFNGFKNVKLISLTSVSVTDEAFDDLLSNCVLLVDLFVCVAKNLRSVKVPESMARLRFLDISLCPDLLELEVHAPNLIGFCFVEDRAKFSFTNISKLQFLRLSGLNDVFGELMRQNLLLQTLALDLDIFARNFVPDFKILPTMTNLKVLTLCVVRLSNGFADVVNFLRATPSLSKFELRLKDPDFVTPKLDAFTENFQHKHLREIQVSGFSGGEQHIELACFLIKISVALEKFTIFPYHIRFYLNQRLCVEPDVDKLASIRRCIDRISCKLPPTAKLEFIDS